MRINIELSVNFDPQTPSKMGTDLQRLNKKMKDLKLDGELFYSTRKDKRYMLVTPASQGSKGRKIHFGYKGPNGEVAQTYFDGASEKKRNAYRARASKIKNKLGELTYQIPYTPNYLAFHFLW